MVVALLEVLLGRKMGVRVCVHLCVFILGRCRYHFALYLEGKIRIIKNYTKSLHQPLLSLPIYIVHRYGIYAINKRRGGSGC